MGIKFRFPLIYLVFFVFLSGFLLLKPVNADSGPGSSSGEGDPNCSCEHEGKQTPDNGISCRIRQFFTHKGSCGTTNYCYNEKNSSGQTVPVCKSPSGAHPIEADKDCWCTNPSSYGKDALGNWQNGKTCSDGLNIYADETHNFCKVYEVCVDSGIAVRDSNAPGKKVGVCQPTNCTCDHQGVAGAGNNSMTCGDGFTVSCGESEVCRQNGNKASCEALPCTCDQPDTPGDGNNGYTCLGTSDGKPYHAACPDKTKACVQNGTAIACVDETGKLNQPPPTAPPAQPPCDKNNYNTQGGCALVHTSIGDISTNPQGFISSLFGVLLSISGAIAVIIIMISGYKMIMSQGDAEKIQGAKESITAAIVGLLFLIFSLVILQVIGVDVLKLPGFGN